MTGETESSRGQDEEVTLIDVLLLVVEHARLLIFGPIVATMVSLGIAFVIPPTFTASTRILPPQQQQQSAAALLASQLGALAGTVGAAGMSINLRNPAETYVALIRSRTVADALIDRFNLLVVYEETYRQEARMELANATKVSTTRDGLITIEVEDRDRQRAADLANAYVEELSKLTGSLAITEAQQRRVFFEKQLQQAQESLTKAQLALGTAGAGESLIKAAPQAVVETIARLKAQVTAHEIRLSTMRGYLSDSSPEFQLVQRALASYRAQLLDAERSQPTITTPKTDYLNRFRDFKYQETLFELMAKQYELARLDEAREGSMVQVVDRAIVPERRSRPRMALIAGLSVLVSILVLFLFVAIRQSLRNAQYDPKTSEKLTRLFAGFRREKE
jgi:uncharacterized protein involved in exopolysaccharide biosynthesis